MLVMTGIAAASAQPSTTIDGGLSLLDAVEATLERDPNIALSRSQVSASRGAWLSSQGRFDPELSSSLDRDHSEIPVDAERSSESTLLSQSFTLTQLLRGGQTLTPSLVLQREELSGADLNEATLSFTFRQPLLRGRGREATAAAEMAAERRYEASRLDLAHTVALRLLTVVRQYWSYRAAAFNLEILHATEASSRELLATTGKLIAADLTPAAEIVQLEADLAFKESNRLAGERTLFAARMALGLEIGLDPDEILALPLAGDPFPEIDPDAVPRAITAVELRDLALARRADLRAANERLKASEILLASADNALEPQLDLVFTPSYSGLVAGDDASDFFSPIYRNVPGLSTSLGLRLAWPIANRQAEGAYLQAEEARRQDVLRVVLFEKDIGAQVAVALDAVRQSAFQVERAATAVELFARAVSNEAKKLRAGSSTLIDLINQRDRLTAAQQQGSAARLVLAQALADLRFQTGSLLDSDGDSGSVSLDPRQLISLPTAEDAP